MRPKAKDDSNNVKRGDAVAQEAVQMTITITRSEWVSLLREMGPHAFWLFSAMTALAEGGQCRLTQEDLASQLGVSESSIRRYITKLSRYRLKGERLVTASREFDSNVYVIANLNIIDDPDSSPRKVVLERKATAAEEIWKYWLDKYKERYGVQYRPSSYGKDRGCLKRLVERYASDTEFLKQIIDTVLRLYDSRWKSKQFLRPTIGQLSSWLAAQAEPFVQVAAEPESEPVITPVDDDGVDLLELIDRKWGD